MELHVQIFATLALQLDCKELLVELGPQPTVSDLLDQIADRHPDIAELLQRTAVAVNMNYVKPNHLLKQGDQVALIPPVSGGCV